VFMLARLPTGNLWDAVLDPVLWAWAVVVCARRARELRHSRASH
jgi:hypothetical protein